MLKELIRFEWRYHTRQASFIAAAALFLAIGFALTATAFGPDKVAVTSPFLVMETLAFASLFSIFAIAVFVSNAVIRDSDHKMEEIVFCTPIGRFNYLLGRFGGAFAATLTAIAFAPLGMIVASQMPWLDPARVGPLNVGLYLWSYVVMVVPTLLFATALLFALATKTRSALATYTASVFIYVLYMVGAALTNSPLMAGSAPGAGGGTLVALFDPFGMSSFFEVTRYWTIAEKNSRFIALTGTLFLNRLLWTGIAFAILGVTYRAFRFRLLKKSKQKAAKRDLGAATPVTYRRIEPARSRLRAAIGSFASATKLEVGAALRSRPLLLLLALWFVLAIFEIRSDLFSAEYGSARYPTTGLIVASIGAPLWILGIILVIYYGAELFWREQRFGVAPIVDATPVRGAVMVLAKWSTIVTLLGTMTATGIAAGVLVQATSGWFRFEPLLYLSLFWFVGLPLALIAAAAVAIHSLSPGKYAGLVLVLVFALLTRRTAMIGLEHPLWRYASGPTVNYSAMYGFANAAAASFAKLMLHWSVMAIGFLAVAAVSWRRLRDGAATRLRGLLRYATTTGRAPLAALLAVLAITGSWVYYDTTIVGRFTTTGERIDRRAEYERRYRSLAQSPQPTVDAVRTRVDLFPESGRLHVSGDYALINATNAPMTTILVSYPRDARQARMSMPEGRLTGDARQGMNRFDLARPLPPGGRTVLHFELAFDDRTFGDESPSVVENGSLVMSSDAFPTLGYRAGTELRDLRERRKRHLGAPTLPDNEDPDAATPSETSDMQRVFVDATVSTSPDQRAFGPGQLLREWTSNGRRYFHFRTDARIPNRFAIASAHYAVARRTVGNVELSVAYHPAHAANVASILDTAARTLDDCSRAFGTYPHRKLDLVEVPASWQFGGFAVPGTVLLSETRAFLVDPRDPNRPDLLTRRVAHEVGHQWWGHQLVPARRAGNTMLVESLAKYTEQRLIEQKHGRDAVRELLAIELDTYLAGRASGDQREPTLATSGNQPYIYYSKGALVLNAVRDLIGEAALDSALHDLLAEKRNGSTATTSDLLRHLRAVSTDVQFALIDEWLRKIVLYDLRVDSAHVEPLPGGRLRVTGQITAAKREAAPDGTEHEIPLDEAIDIAVMRRPTADTPSVDTLAIQRVPLHSGTNQVTFLVNEAPVYLAVDPWLLRIDHNRFDNGRKVER